MLHGQVQFLRRDSREKTPTLQVEKTESVRERTRGLLGRPALQTHQGFWIKPCNSVHTFGMRYPIDIVYLDRQQQIRKIRPNLKPSRISWHLLARSVIELQAGAVKALDLRTGDELQWAAHD